MLYTTYLSKAERNGLKKLVQILDGEFEEN